MSDTPRETAPEDKDLPGQGTRTFVSFLLFVHLFSLFVTIVLSANSSALTQKLRRVPGFYLQWLYMDLEYDAGTRFRPASTMMLNDRDQPKARRGLYHLTRADVDDVDYFVEVAHGEDGESPIWQFPNDEMSGARRRHYKMLAWEMGRLAEENPGQSILPASVGRALLMRFGVPIGQKTRLRVKRVLTRSTEQATSSDPATRDPWSASRVQVAYDKLAWLDEHGNCLLSAPHEPGQSVQGVERQGTEETPGENGGQGTRGAQSSGNGGQGAVDRRQPTDPLPGPTPRPQSKQ